MSVYIDRTTTIIGQKVLSHMIADSHEELIEMVRLIGVSPRWIKKPGTIFEHFDVCMTRRKLAIECGAVEISTRELGMRIRRKRNREQTASRAS